MIRSSARTLCSFVPPRELSTQLLDALKIRIDAYDHVVASKISWPGALSLGGACSGAVLFFGNWKADVLSTRLDEQGREIRRLGGEVKEHTEQLRSLCEQLRTQGEQISAIHELVAKLSTKMETGSPTPACTQG